MTLKVSKGHTRRRMALAIEFLDSGNNICRRRMRARFLMLCALIPLAVWQAFVATQTSGLMSPHVVRGGNDITSARASFSDGSKSFALEKFRDIAGSISVADIIAETMYSQKDSNELEEVIRMEKRKGERDRYFLPSSYRARFKNKHHVDIGNTDNHQKEVYLVARDIMRKLVTSGNSTITEAKNITNSSLEGGKPRRGIVFDVGTGSGYKLVKFLSPEFRTIGIETKPAISYVRKKYPRQEWIDSGIQEKNISNGTRIIESYPSCNLCICADVIEHMQDPDTLLTFLRTLKCQIYVISTPMQEHTKSAYGPPGNLAHVREWTFHEFRLYLGEKSFEVMKSFDGVQHQTTQFHIAMLAQ